MKQCPTVARNLAESLSSGSKARPCGPIGRLNTREPGRVRSEPSPCLVPACQAPRNASSNCESALRPGYSCMSRRLRIARPRWPRARATLGVQRPLRESGLRHQLLSPPEQDYPCTKAIWGQFGRWHPTPATRRGWAGATGSTQVLSAQQRPGGNTMIKLTEIAIIHDLRRQRHYIATIASETRPRV